MERTRAKLGIKDITMHDLRRTAGTYMSEYGVPKDVRERILNHGGMRKGSITESVYNRYEYDAEKRAALELWADALAGIISGHPTEVRGYHARLARLKERQDHGHLDGCLASPYRLGDVNGIAHGAVRGPPA